MKNTKVLELLNNGEIEELKRMLQDEIYQDSLKNNGNAKKRYMAMKRYFKYSSKNNSLGMKMPCKDINIDGKLYNSFLDGYSFALTTENIGELESFDKSKGEYFKIDKLIDFTGDMEKININTILAEAKVEGYKYKKSELADNNDFQYILKYKDGYYKIGLLDQAYSIIDNGENVEVYYKNNKSLLMIKTSIGFCGILPINFKNGTPNIKIIDIEALLEVA